MNALPELPPLPAALPAAAHPLRRRRPRSMAALFRQRTRARILGEALAGIDQQCTSWYGHKLVSARIDGSLVMYCSVCGHNPSLPERRPAPCPAWNGHQFVRDGQTLTCSVCTEHVPVPRSAHTPTKENHA